MPLFLPSACASLLLLAVVLLLPLARKGSRYASLLIVGLLLLVIWMWVSKVPLSYLDFGFSSLLLGIILHSRQVLVRESTGWQPYYKTVFQENLDSILLINLEDGCLLDFNDMACSSLGYSREEFEKLLLHDFVDDTLEESLAVAYEEGSRAFETCLRHKSGEIRNQRVNARRLQANNRRVILAMLHDITDAKRAKQDLERSERSLANAQRIAGMGNWERDLTGQTNKCSLQLRRILGLAEDCEFLFEDLLRLIHPKERDDVENALVEAGRLGQKLELHCRFQRDDGVIRRLYLRAEAIIDENGKNVGQHGVVLDETERRRVEEVLDETNLRLHAVAHALPELILIVDEDGNNVEVVSGEKNLPPHVGDLMSRPVQEILPLESASNCLAMMAKALATNKTQRVVYKQCTTGKIHWFEGRAIPLNLIFESPKMVVWTAVDITQRTEAEERLILLSRAVEQSMAQVIIADVNGDIEYVNKRFSTDTGYLPEEVIGRNPRFLKSGKTPVDDYKELWSTITSGGTWQGIMLNRKKYGELYYDRSVISAVRNSVGEITHFLAIKEDITKMRRMEEEKLLLEGQLRQSQKLETLGTLAGGIAHDFNNILSPILGYTEMAIMKVNCKTGLEKSKLAKYLNHVLSAANRARELVEQILTFSRAPEKGTAPMELQQLLVEAVKLLRGWIPSSIEIETIIKEDCLPIHGDPTQLHQIIMNLATNAYQAMRPDGGRLLLSLEQVEVNSEMTLSNPELKPGRKVRLMVHDEGIGMDEATIERIFEPFFTTKEVGEGTGLGLSVVHGIVKSHKAVLTVESQQGVGTTFCIYFEPAMENVIEEGLDPEIDIVHGGNARILFVDDNEAVGAMMKEMMEQQGYLVTIYNCALEALVLFTKNPLAFDLVITDQTMPRMAGLQLCQQIKEVRPNLPVILISGHREGTEEAILPDSGVNRFLTKPVPGKLLCQVVAEELNIARG